MSFFNLPQDETAYGLLGKSLGQGFGGGLSQSLQGWLGKRENIRKAAGLSPFLQELGVPSQDIQTMINSGLSPQELIPLAGLLQKHRASEESNRTRISNSQISTLEKGRPLVGKHIDALFKAQGKGYDAATIDKAREMAIGLFESGKDPYSAALEVYQRFTNPELQDQIPTNRTQGRREGLGEDVKGAVAKMARGPVGLLDVTGRLGDFLGGLGTKAVQSLRGMTPEQIAAQDERAKDLPKPFLDTSGVLEKFDELTGGRGIIGENVEGDILGNVNKAIQRVVGASSLGGLPMVAAQSGEEILKSAGFGEIAQFIGGLGGLAAAEKLGLSLAPIFQRLEKIVSRVPSASKALNEASKVAEIPKEKIVQEAAQNLERRGVNVLKAGEGDPAALNELQKEVNKVSETFQTAERQSVKELQKVRQDIAKKLPESPLEKYYAPKKEVVSRPETIAKEEARISPLQSQIKQNERRLKNLQYEVLNGKSALREGNLVPEAIARLESNLALNRLHHEKTLNEIRNLNFEIKYKRPPMTTENIQKQIEETFTKLREGIKNPTAEKVEAFRKGIERDREAIATAEKLAARGEIPGKPVFDEFIKIHEQYNKAYSDLSKELGDFIKDKKGNKRLAKQVANATELRRIVDEAKKIGEAKVANQIDKRRAMREIDKPASGAFYRQMLKDLRKDVDAFQRDFFKWKQIANSEEAKVAQKGAEAIKSSAAAKEGKALGSPQKVVQEAKEAIIKPTEEKINTIAQEANASPQEIKSFLGEMKDGWKNLETKFKNKALKDKDISTFSGRLSKELQKIKSGIKSGLIIGSIQGLIEQFTGYKPSQSIIGGAAVVFTPGGLKSRGAALGLTPIIAQWIRNGFEYLDAQELKSFRNTPKFNQRVKELNEKYPTAKVNRIVKKATS